MKVLKLIAFVLAVLMTNVACEKSAASHASPVNRVEKVNKTFPAWRTVTLGKHKTVEEFSTAIEASGRQISKFARDMASEVVLAKKPTDVELVNIIGSDVGLEGTYTTQQMIAAAESYGLFKNLAEVGLALAEQYPDQPESEVVIAMDTITLYGGGLSMFSVDHYSFGRYLDASDGHRDYVWNVDHRWVFSYSRR